MFPTIKPGLITVKEVDNSPSVIANTLIFPNGTVIDNTDGSVTINNGTDLSAIYAITTDPLVAGSPWNSGGFLKFSAGVSSYSPSMDFSDARNSMYIPLLFEDF